MAGLLSSIEPELRFTMVSMDTFGDRRRDLPIAALGGKGAFSKEVQQLVLAGEADLAVHSAKDLQAVTPDGLTIAAFPERGDARDAIVGARLGDLASGARLGSGSNRRSALLNDLRPDLELTGLRGNIGTRLDRLDELDAVVMAAVALERLGIDGPTIDRLDPEVFVPQVGQGALAVEVRDDASDVIDLVGRINHRQTEIAVSAERSFLVELGGDCALPAGAHAVVMGDDDADGESKLEIRGVLADDACANLQRAVEIGPASDDPGRDLAARLRDRLDQAVG